MGGMPAKPSQNIDRLKVLKEGNDGPNANYDASGVRPNPTDRKRKWSQRGLAVVEQSKKKSAACQCSRQVRISIRPQINVERFQVVPLPTQSAKLIVEQLWFFSQNSFGETRPLDALAAAQANPNSGLRFFTEAMLGETGYWNPAVVTDKDGKASVTFRLPERSTAWRLRAAGIDAGSLAGEADADFVAKKDFFGEMKLPAHSRPATGLTSSSTCKMRPSRATPRLKSV